MNEVKTLTQLVRYGVMGVSGVIIDATVYSLLLHLGCSLTLSKGIGIFTSIIYAFIGNTLWTFGARISLRVCVRFAAIYAASLLANVYVNGKMFQLLQHQFAYALQEAFLCATAVSVVITFGGLKLWVYKA